MAMRNSFPCRYRRLAWTVSGQQRRLTCADRSGTPALVCNDENHSDWCFLVYAASASRCQSGGGVAVEKPPAESNDHPPTIDVKSARLSLFPRLTCAHCRKRFAERSRSSLDEIRFEHLTAALFAWGPYRILFELRRP
jgi:hypothetical protein